MRKTDSRSVTTARLAGALSSPGRFLRSSSSQAACSRKCEVYFLRAFYYFDLVNNFGGVPLVLKPLSSFDEAYSVAKRETPDKVYAQISLDLAQAKTLLPNSKHSDPVETWRASKGAVLALQAKVALYNQQWTDVISIVTELEGLSFYSLNANYFDSFDVAKEATETEVIFDYDHQSLH